MMQRLISSSTSTVASRTILCRASCTSAVASSSATRFSATSSSSSIASFSTHAHSSHRPSILVVGGSGALGGAMIDTFKSAGWRTICMDYKANSASDTNITLARSATWKANLTLAEESLNELVESERKQHAQTKSTPPLSVVVHCAGSWLGGALNDAAFLDSVDPMLDINLKSGISAAFLASKFLTDSGAGLLVLTGAAAAGSGSSLAPTAGMIGYGMSKAATHQLAVSCAQRESGLKNATVVCVLPTMIDTPSNRTMTTAPEVIQNWTPPRDFAELALAFAQQLQGAIGVTGKAASGTTSSSKTAIEHAKVQLKHGGFYVFTTEKGKTQIKLLP